MRRLFFLSLAALMATASVAEPHHLVFKAIEGETAFRQALQWETYRLVQTEPRAFSFTCNAKGVGLDASVAPNSRKFGVEMKITYADGSVKWYTPPKLLDPAMVGWQNVSGVFVPPRAVAEVVFYFRLATTGEADFENVSIEELPADVIHGDCSVANDGRRIVMENDFLRLAVDPANGGSGVSFVAKRSGVEYTSAEPRYGMFLDKFRTGGNCERRAYEATVVGNTPDEAEVALILRGPDGFQFLEIEKHLRLTRDSGGLDVRYVFRNLPASMGEMVIEPWFKSTVVPHGVKEQLHYVPTEKGVRTFGVSLGDLYPEGVVAGWVAVGDSVGKTMAVEYDYSHLAKPYLWLGGMDHTAMEWCFQPVSIAAGETFETTIHAYPADGLAKPDGCANGIAAEFVLADTVSVRLASAKSHILRAELAVRTRDGTRRKAVKFLKTGPDGAITWDSGLSAKDLSLAGLRLFSDDALVFETARSTEADYVYRPSVAKAKPAEVKPFTLHLSDAVKSEAAALAKPWSAGKVRVLFLTDLAAQRENVELMERMDLEARTIRISYAADWNNWGMVDRYATFSFEDSNLSLKHELTRPTDVIVVSGRIWDHVNAENREKIAVLTASGKTGLVVIGNRAALPKDLVADAAGTDYVARAIDRELLPFGADRLNAFSKDGRRAVFCDYEAKEGLTPYVDYAAKPPAFRYWDYSLLAVARAILWSAKRDRSCGEGLKKSEDWFEPHPKLRVGHVVWSDEKGVVDFACRAERRETAASIVSLTATPDPVGPDGAVTGGLKADGGAARVSLVDGFGRVLAVAENVTGAFALSVRGARTVALSVKAELYRDGTLCDIRTADALCRCPPESPDFVFGIGIESPMRGAKTYLRDLYMREARKLGVNQIRFWRMQPEAISRFYSRYGLGLDYPVADLRIGQWRFPQEFGEPYAKTKDKKYLVRKPCYHDPDFVSGDLKCIAANIGAALRYSPCSLDCGDETTLTMWATPFDFCFGEHTLRAFRTWLKGEYGDLAALNAAWGTEFQDWDAVVPDTTEESTLRQKRTGRRAYGAWADHRRFMELTFCGYVAKIKAMMEEKCPGLSFDMSGTQQPNGWTGMDMWLIGQSIDIPAAYDGCCLAEIIRSFGRPLVKPWYGYGCGGNQVHRLWRDAFRFRNFGIAFFSEGNLLMPDYTRHPRVMELVNGLKDLRAGGQRLLRSLEMDVEALIHYSQASIHAAQIESRYDEFIAARERTVKALDAAGTPYRFIAYAEIENGELERTTAKTLYLPQSAALSPKECAAIRAFAARGGKVYGDRYSGIMDTHCRLLGKSPVADAVDADVKFAPDPGDGIQAFRYRSRLGLDGTYFGFVRSPGAKGAGRRTVTMPNTGWTYDLRTKKCLGEKSSFDFELAPGDAAFFAALPYEVKGLSVKAPETIVAGDEVKLSFELTGSARISAFHPIRFEVLAPDGSRHALYSGMSDTSDGKGQYAFRTALNDPMGIWRIVATDFISGKSSVASLMLYGGTDK